jgi:hypothetical protein
MVPTATRRPSQETGWSRRSELTRSTNGTAYFRLQSLWCFGLLFAFPGLALAQDALRASLAGEASSQAVHQELESLPYTFKFGDLKLLVTPSLGLDWNDCIDLSGSTSKQDVILRPMVQFQGGYPLTAYNLLSVSVGVGYDKYFLHDDYSGVRIESGSQLNFDVGVKDFRFNFHDRFQYSRDSAGQSAVAGSGRYGGLDNSAGLSATWDLRDVTLNAGYDHQNFISSSSDFSSNTHSSEQMVGRAGFRFNPQLTAGIEGTGSFTSYEQQGLNNSVGYSVGLYGDVRPGKFFQIQPRVGYTIYDFQQTSRSIQAMNQNAWYAGVTVRHELTDAFNYSVSAGHELRLGIQADSVDSWYFRPNFTWNIIRDVRLSTDFSYEHGTQGNSQQGGGVSETFDWFGGGLGIGLSLTKKLDMSLDYRLTVRSSNAASRDYTQNLVGLRLTYLLQ